MTATHITTKMEGVTLCENDNSTNGTSRQRTSSPNSAPQAGSSSASSLPPQPRPLVTPKETDTRPWDVAKAAGPPAGPVPFPAPVIHRGRRVEVCCYIPSTGQHERLSNVLMSDEPRKSNVRELAYYPIPHKKPIKTIMGHVEICVVLKRCVKDEEDTSQEDEELFVVDEDEDVVFELTEEYVAVKVNFDRKMRELRSRHAEDPLKEIAAMQLIGEKSEHVMGCRDVLYDAKTQTVNVVLRYCPHGDLFQMLQDVQQFATDTTPGLSEPQARYWFKQILLGLRHLRDLGIVHRDLSPENVMMDHNQCLVIDLGMCLRVPYTDPKKAGGTTDISRGTQKRLISPQGACGKLPYMSPEIYKNRSEFDGEAADVWTAGTILFCMVTGNRSYQRPHSSDPQFYWMTRGLKQMLSDWGVPISPQGLHLMQNLLQVDPRLRLTVDEALSHPWFDLPTEEMDLSNPMAL